MRRDKRRLLRVVQYDVDVEVRVMFEEARQQRNDMQTGEGLRRRHAQPA